MIAGRYLRARRKEAFISVIASLTTIGVAIGVATLIVVWLVHNWRNHKQKVLDDASKVGAAFDKAKDAVGSAIDKAKS